MENNPDKEFGASSVLNLNEVYVLIAIGLCIKATSCCLMGTQ